MRGIIFDTLFLRMAENENIFFLTADMGINLVERIQKAYPDRFANVGIAEQNLIGVAAGLCNTGFRPFAYTISNFLVHRCFEQIRNDIIIHHYPIVLLGVGVGFDNPPLGPTHHILDDWGTLKALPGIDIYCPATGEYAEGIVDRVLAVGRPAYVRIAKGRPSLPCTSADICFIPAQGTARHLVVSYGSLAQEAVKLHGMRDNVAVLVLNKLYPLDEAALAQVLSGYQSVLVLEDHFAYSGLYGELCGLCQRQGVVARLETAAPPSDYRFVVGASAGWFYHAYGMDARSLSARLPTA